MSEIGELILKMENDDYSGFEYGDLERVLAADPKRGVQLIWHSLRTLDYQAVPGCASLCLDLWNALRKANAIDEDQILREWPNISCTARSNFCCAFSDPELLSSNLGITLFHHSASTVDDRYMIVIELYRVARQGRLQKAVVLDLLSHIGRYSDDALQKSLDRFIHAVEEEFQTATAVA